MPVKKAAELNAIAKKILLAAGADELNAAGVAEHLVASNLCGVDTHGIWQLPLYVDRIRAGEVVPTARPEILRETATTVLVTGNWGLGHVPAKYAMEIAIKKAAAHNVAVAGLVQLDHIGRLGAYAEMAAAAGMISLIMASGFSRDASWAVPYGGRERILHTNPMAMGFPAREEPPMAFDFATTAIAGAKLLRAHELNQPLPTNAIVDKQGSPSTNPQDFFDGGGILPFGGHKGYALMLTVEFMGRILTGSEAYTDPQHADAIFGHQGVSMAVIKGDVFQPFSDYARRADELERRVRAVPPAPGFDQVLVPGDPERHTRAVRQRDGIPIPDDTWQQLVDVATSLGVTI